ncbi:MAG: SRPBCC family protein [Bacteroidota bacterium]|nr:SRPBCC family protein [Bacteroidota bacterium]
MKTLKIISIAIAVIIALPLIVALFVPKTFTVSVSETINQPRQRVYDYVRILDNQKDYSVWVMADSSLNPEIIGKDGTVGAVQKWNSQIDDVGEGEQEIKALTPERMDVELRFKRPFAGTAKAANIFKFISENKTLLTSEFYSDSKYPMNLPSYLFGRKMMEDAQTKNLQNIKRILENPNSFGISDVSN